MGQTRQKMVWAGLVLVLFAGQVRVVGAGDPNLVGWWKLDENQGTMAEDASGNGNDGTLKGGVQWQPSGGRIDGALKFNGSSGYVLIPAGSGLQLVNKRDYTLALWFRQEVATGTVNLLQQGDRNGTGRTLLLSDAANGIRSYLGAVNTLSGVTAQAGRWYHVAMVVTEQGATDTVQMYINGQASGTPGRVASESSEGDFILSSNKAFDGRWVNGLIDDVRFYNRALKEAEIKALIPPRLQAYEPSPAPGDQAVVAPLLRWTAGETAVLHNVYLGTSPDLGTAELVAARTPVPMYYHTPGLQPGTTYYWRVDEIELDGTTIHAGTVWSFTTQALTAYGPSPADGDTSVAPAVTLAWLPGKSALKHRVYLSDSRDAVAQGTTPADKGEQTQTTLAPAGLEGATTYYWRVDEILIDGTIQAGPVWSFTTFLLVDDFENYDDNVDAGTTIFDTWIDGWTNNTGSQVGNTTAPFAERTIVHGGKQAMPLDYNNVNAPFYSEAERDFATAQDWTVGDMTTLVLFVRGRAGNGPAPLYVAIRDATNRTATVVHPDAAVISAARWTEWKIPLEALTGVNPARIKRITLGLGDKAAPKPGGAGRIYLDDIRVTK